MYCKNCGKEIDDNAVVCPGCGVPTKDKKQKHKKKKHPILSTILVIFAILVVVGIVSGNSDSPKKVESQNVGSQNAENQKVETSAPEKTEFTVGDSVELDGITVTLVDVSESTGANFMTPTDGNVFVICEFEIENGSDEDIAVSSIVSFEAYIDDYSTNINLSAIASAEKGQLDGSVAAGKKMAGAIGYEAAKDWKELEVRFTPSFWSGKEIVFTYTK